jgi:hypothetical protein
MYLEHGINLSCLEFTIYIAQWPATAGGSCDTAIPGSEGLSAATHFRFAYSALACFRIGMSGSASLQRVRKSR